jgi:hypothetical protein
VANACCIIRIDIIQYLVILVKYIKRFADSENMPEFRNTFDLIEILAKQSWLTKKGLLYYSIALLIFLTSFALFLSGLGTGEILSDVGIQIKKIDVASTIIIILFAHFLLWYILRQGIYISDKIIINFALKSELQSSISIREILKNIKRGLSNNSLGDIIEINYLPDDRVFHSSVDAEKYVKNKQVNLLVWGDTTEATRNNLPITIINLNFTYLHASLQSEQKKLLQKELRSASQRSVWEIDHTNSVIGITVVSGNIFEVSLFVLAACLITVPDIQYHLKAVIILEQLAVSLSAKRKDPNFPNLRDVQHQITNLLLQLYNNLSLYYSQSKQDFVKGEFYAQKALMLDSHNFGAHQNLALLYWKKGEETLSRKHSKIAWNIEQSNDLTRCNRAFLRIYDKNFEAGLRTYKKISHLEPFTVLQVVEFIESEYEKKSDNSGLLFAYAWISIKFGDSIRGKTKMEKFLRKVSANKEYTVLIEEAKRML